ncbi:hypothetical protein EDM59_14560 [Brevibacillus nitrificans]|uniref:Uncharacterized protein n=1 Tax=Brevibacillus nitrificans TaxID=651560 RepID=A0A3M8D6P8_9BACL|nr:hypothetical protein [Brevibacillus nitrificans]RNB83750.1 hypothetical protein EDM59_14560 [Brevibacillus nitrificans]
MNLPDVIQLGPFLVKMSMLIIAISILLAFAAVHLRLREERVFKKTIWEVMSSSILLGFVVWKFSYILLYPSKAMAQPASILYFSGGDRGFWLALLAVIVYLVVTVRKRGIPAPAFAASLALSGWTTWAAFFLLSWAVDGQNGWYDVQQAAIGVVFLLLVIRKWETLTSAVPWLSLLMWFGISQVYVGFFSQQRSLLFAGLSKTQWLYYLFAVLAWFLVSRARQTGGATHEKE